MDPPSIQLLVPAHHPPLQGQPESSLPATPSSREQVHGFNVTLSLFPASPVSAGPGRRQQALPRLWLSQTHRLASLEQNRQVWGLHAWAPRLQMRSEAAPGCVCAQTRSVEAAPRSPQER